MLIDGMVDYAVGDQVGQAWFGFQPHDSIDTLIIGFEKVTWIIAFDFIVSSCNWGGDVGSYITDDKCVLTFSVDGRHAIVNFDKTMVQAFADKCAEWIESNEIVIPHQRTKEVDMLLAELF